MADKPMKMANQPNDVVEWRSVSRMLGLMAIMWSKMKSVRLLVSDHGGGMEVHQSEMPPLADLFKAMDALFRVSNRTDSGALQSSAASSAGRGDDQESRIFEAPERGHGWVETTLNFEAAISALLGKSSEAKVDPLIADTTRWPIMHGASDVRGANALLMVRDALAHGMDSAPQTRDSVLEISVARDIGTWAIDFVKPQQLQGEDLGQLQANAPTSAIASGLQSDLLGEAYLSAAEAARCLGVAKSTVTRRIERNEMIGFRAFKQALRIPKDQLLDGDVVPGIRDVLSLFARPGVSGKDAVDHKSAWLFLGGELFHGDPDPRPIDRLRGAARTATTEQILAELVRVKNSVDRGDYL